MDGILMSIIHSNEIIVNLRLIQTWVSWNPSFYHCPIVLRSISPTSAPLKHNCHHSPDTPRFPIVHHYFPSFPLTFISALESPTQIHFYDPFGDHMGKVTSLRTSGTLYRCPRHCRVHLSFPMIHRFILAFSIAYTSLHHVLCILAYLLNI